MVELKLNFILLIKKFLSELYVFLVDEMHKLLNEYLTLEDEPHEEITFTDMQQLKHFAVEAEINQNYDLAAYYYQEVENKTFNNYIISQTKKIQISRELQEKKIAIRIGLIMLYLTCLSMILWEPKSVWKSAFRSIQIKLMR